MSRWSICLAVAVWAPSVALAVDVGDYPLTAVPYRDVTVEDAFWSPRMETNRRETIPHCLKMCEETGRIRNFARAAGLMDGGFEGIYFNDSDVYKFIEGTAYSLKNRPDPVLEKYLDGIIDKIAAAQWEDGYICTFYTVPKRRPQDRWTDVMMHELYCGGHLIEAGVAYHRVTGKRKLLDVGIKFADHCVDRFAVDQVRTIPGHQEIELALMRLFRATGERKYLGLAQFFLDERGQYHDRPVYGVPGRPHYLQDHTPVREQFEAVGHTVRAGLYVRRHGRHGRRRR